MALDDKEIFNAVFTRYNDQSIEFVMAQYAKAKKMNMDLEKMLASSASAPSEPEECEVVEVETPAEPAPKRWTKRMLKFKDTQNSITQDYIICCICGEQRQSLTAKHLANHGITVDDYKRLCDFTPNTPLMSGKRLAKSRDVIARAQKARLAKREVEKED